MNNRLGRFLGGNLPHGSSLYAGSSDCPSPLFMGFRQWHKVSVKFHTFLEEPLRETIKLNLSDHLFRNSQP